MSDEVVTAAPEFELESVAGGAMRLSDLRSDGPVLVLFVAEECPTSALTLRRLGRLVPSLAAAGVTVAAVFEDPLEVAARTARRAGFAATLLAEPPPYDVSRAYELSSVPTTVLVGRDGNLIGRVVGWDAGALEELIEEACGAPVAVTQESPMRKPGCAAKSTYDAQTLRLLDAGSGQDELEEMFERGWTDGLPVIPPTRERVEAMLGGRDPAASLGEVPPGMGEATLERVAACAVLAGCRPDYFPVVLAAAEAALEPAFNLGGQAVTTQPVGQLVIVNGPVRDTIGLNGAMGALGPGWRANMTIGRAVRLLVSLTGGGFPGRLDRAALGQPGKVGVCVAEDEERSPWEPLHVERGFDREQSVVTLVACDAPLSISDHRSRSPEELAAVLGWAAAGAWSTNWWPLGTRSVFVICPEHAELFRKHRWDKRRLREAMFTAVRRPAGELRWGETTPHVERARDEEPVTKWTSPDDIVLIVAGGEAGRFSAVFGPCLGMNDEIISREVRWTT
ncbi:MAG: redoxin domain-containing protein [Solirubrobacterales bacterium]|nr:redoxin domain-containing protein [Solirubrobacterales bacterium]MBV9421669.1 redoxin domain-containing protein [Solirubrobacterales bacterium]MBV9800790.1 redoxin domain-containing protein [Solirubrobacterales bacterium]